MSSTFSFLSCWCSSCAVDKGEIIPEDSLKSESEDEVEAEGEGDIPYIEPQDTFVDKKSKQDYIDAVKELVDNGKYKYKFKFNEMLDNNSANAEKKEICNESKPITLRRIGTMSTMPRSKTVNMAV